MRFYINPFIQSVNQETSKQANKKTSKQESKKTRNQELWSHWPTFSYQSSGTKVKIEAQYDDDCFNDIMIRASAWHTIDCDSIPIRNICILLHVSQYPFWIWLPCHIQISSSNSSIVELCFSFNISIVNVFNSSQKSQIISHPSNFQSSIICFCDWMLPFKISFLIRSSQTYSVFNKFDLSIIFKISFQNH
jgi:hypothetical protein